MMKKLILILLLFLPFAGFTQFEAGEYFNGDTAKVGGTSIIYPGDSVGQFHYSKMRDPSEDLDGVNLRTLFDRLASFDSLGLLVSDIVSGSTTINSGETQIFFPSAFDSNNVTVVPYVRRVSDDAVIDYSINDVDQNGFDIVVWENNVKLSYVASNRVSHSGDIFGEPIYSADSIFLKSGVRSWNSSLAKTIDATDTTRWVNEIASKKANSDSTGNTGYVSRLRLTHDLVAKQNLLVNSAGLAGALSDETGTGLSVFNTSPTFLGTINTNTNDVTVLNRNKYRPLLSFSNNILMLFQDSIWSSTSYISNQGYGFGHAALQNNIGAYSNGFGAYALQNNIGTNSNGFGAYALQNNIGTNSNGFGHYALYNNIGAYSNGFGHAALQNNIGAYSNGFGYAAIRNNIGANSNGFGAYALYDNIGAYSNGFGHAALQNNIGANSNGFGHAALRNNIGTSSNGFGLYALYDNIGAYSNGFGLYALYNNNWANVLSFGNQVIDYFLDNPATDKTFNRTSMDSVAHTITFSSAHGFGTTNNKVNLRFTLLTGTAPVGLTTNVVYRFTITSANILTYSGITGRGSADFSGKLTNSVDINNSIAIGNNVNASKANQVVIGSPSIVETLLFGNVQVGTLKSEVISANLTDTTPTDAEIDTATGLTPSTAGAGWECWIKDTNGSGSMYRVVSDGTDWNYIMLTKAL